jgi:hypothetical protein
LAATLKDGVVSADVSPGYDVFISHASEDKVDVARPLYDELCRLRYRVWYDEAVLTLGDSLRRKIDEGLRMSRYGAVILSPSFFAKNWPQTELDGLAAREMASGEKVVLPVWHRVTRDDVLRYSPTLADRLAVSTSEGLDPVVSKLVEVLRAKAGREPLIATRRTLDALTSDEREALRRDIARGRQARCPEDDSILTVNDVTTFGSVGKAYMVDCPICGKVATLESPQLR